MKIAEIIHIIESIAPLSGSASWDKSGIQVAASRSDAAHLGVMLDPALPLLHEAVNAGADMLLSHHPLILQPRFPDRLDSYHGTLALLLTHDILLYSAHTSLDSSVAGPAGWLADALRLRKRNTLEEFAPGYGFGIVGDLPASAPYPVFARKLAALLGKDTWSSCGPEPGRITRVAYCPGSGGDFRKAAAQAGADIYITGDIKYHTALDAEIPILDVGHFCLEHIMVRHFADILRESMPHITVTFFPSRDPLRPQAASMPGQAGAHTAPSKSCSQGGHAIEPLS